MRTITEKLLTICRTFAAVERSAICCGDVSVQQCVVLSQLLGGSQDMGQLAAGSGASTSAMTRLVDGMQRKGWVHRDRDPGDRRRVTVALTDSGRLQAEHLVQRTKEAIEAVLATIPEEHHAAVADALQRVADGLHAAYSGGCCSC